VTRACECGTVLSRYNPSTHCAACEPSKVTHVEFTLANDPARARMIATQLVGEVGKCARGHELSIHGKLRNAGGGRITRICGVCAAARARKYRAQKAAA